MTAWRLKLLLTPWMRRVATQTLWLTVGPATECRDHAVIQLHRTKPVLLPGGTWFGGIAVAFDVMLTDNLPPSLRRERFVCIECANCKKIDPRTLEWKGGARGLNDAPMV